MLEATILPNFVFTRSDRLRPNTKIIRLSGSELVKTIVDDFAMTGYCKLVSNLALRAAEVRLVIRFVNMREAIPRTPPHQNKHNTRTQPTTKHFNARPYSRCRANTCPVRSKCRVNLTW